MLTMDFEASCLPRAGRSFPIEVGIAGPAGWSRSWLIRPIAEWSDWTWTEEAEALHGISRDQLLREGQPPVEVMAELNAITSGHPVVADHDLDRHWLQVLAEAAGVAPQFQVVHVSELLDRCQADPASIQRAVDLADDAVPARHRAGPDAVWLARLTAYLAPGERALFDWR